MAWIHPALGLTFGNVVIIRRGTEIVLISEQTDTQPLCSYLQPSRFQPHKAIIRASGCQEQHGVRASCSEFKLYICCTLCILQRHGDVTRPVERR